MPRAGSAPSGLGLDSAAVRARMVATPARRRALHERGAARRWAACERHRFVDSALVNQAYEDTSLPIGLGQTISKPNVVARMIELLLGGAGIARARRPGPRAGDRHRLRLPGRACWPAGAREVYSIERLRGLHDKARDNLRPLRAGQRAPAVSATACWAMRRRRALRRHHRRGRRRGTCRRPGSTSSPIGGRLVAPMHDAARGGSRSLVVDRQTARAAAAQRARGGALRPPKIGHRIEGRHCVHRMLAQRAHRRWLALVRGTLRAGRAARRRAAARRSKIAAPRAACAVQRRGQRAGAAVSAPMAAAKRRCRAPRTPASPATTPSSPATR